jgi:hypothetical protein
VMATYIAEKTAAWLTFSFAATLGSPGSAAKCSPLRQGWHTAHGEPVSSDYHNKNLQISSGGAAARAGLIDRSRPRARGI